MGHIGNGFYESNDTTNSVKALKEKRVIRIRLQSHQVHSTSSGSPGRQSENRLCHKTGCRLSLISVRFTVTLPATEHQYSAVTIKLHWWMTVTRVWTTWPKSWHDSEKVSSQSATSCYRVWHHNYNISIKASPNLHPHLITNKPALFRATREMGVILVETA